jgi:hypothetical protein
MEGAAVMSLERYVANLDPDLPEAAIAAIDAIRCYARVVEGHCKDCGDENGKLMEHVRECRAIAEKIEGWELDDTLHGLIQKAAGGKQP